MNFIELHHLKKLEHIKRQTKYNKSIKGKLRTQYNSSKYYYRKNNIYHPIFNIDGTIEKRIKRQLPHLS